MNLTEKTAYLKGLADGLNYNKETAEGKLIAALIDLVDEMAKDISVLDEAVEELNDYIEEIDEDLGDVEEYLMEEDEEYDDCDCDCCDCDCDCDCDCCDCDCDCDCEDDEDDEYFEIECPSCGEVVCFDESIDPEDLVCPACHEKFACVVDEDDLKALDEK